jgi:hypothetical protein
MLTVTQTYTPNGHQITTGPRSVTGAPVAPATRCRVAEQAQHAAFLADGLGQTLRTLREYQADCETCRLHGTCQTPGWNASLDTALRDIAHEWGLI